jgi:GntR family transcriptional regulator, sialic acid-inducible nan operon repressor
MKPPPSVMPLLRRKRSDEIAEHVEPAIFTGELKEGAGVGRLSVRREALFILQHRGLVETTSDTRARVTTLSGKFLAGQAATLIRRMTATSEGHMHMEHVPLFLEAGVAWQAVRIPTDEDIAGLKAALDANTAALGNIGLFIRTDDYPRSDARLQ